MEELEPRLVLSVPTPDHVVIVIEENHAFSQIIGSRQAPYINGLAQAGALFTNSHGIGHPSQPNYLEFFSGSAQGITSDSCPHTFHTENLGGDLEAYGYSFGGYSEDMPYDGYTGCSYQNYARKHNPWVDFPDDVPAGDNLIYAEFPSDYTTLPTVAIVVPNQLNDMHSGSIARADSWLANNLDPYVQWTYDNNSLLIVTWDEDNGSVPNRIPTIFVGPMVNPGQYDEMINHYNVLRTLEDMYGLPYAGQAADVNPIEDVWVDSSGSPGAHSLRVGPRSHRQNDATLALVVGQPRSGNVNGLPPLASATVSPGGTSAGPIGRAQSEPSPVSTPGPVTSTSAQQWAEGQGSARSYVNTKVSAVGQLFMELPTHDVVYFLP